MPERGQRPWELRPPAGPVVVIAIDHVVADMGEWEHLVDAPRHADRDWKEFHRHFGDAASVKPGMRLARTLDAAGFTVIWSTTRLESALPVTDRWLRQRHLPGRTIYARSLAWDGNRPARQVTRRHFWDHTRKIGDSHPIAAFVHPDPDTVALLQDDGCPAWLPADLIRATRTVPAVGVVLLGGPPGTEPAELIRWRDERGPQWRRSERAWKDRRALWARRNSKRQRKIAAEHRQEAGESDVEGLASDPPVQTQPQP